MPVADTKSTLTWVLRDQVSGPAGNVSSALDKAAGKGKNFGNIMKGIGLGIGAAGFNALTSALGGVTEYISGSIQAASDLNETVSKVGVVFGDSAKEILAWGEDSATALGMSKNQALSAAGTYGNLLVSLGLTGEKAAGMSKEMVGLAADLASFNNASPEETLAAIQSGLVGETEPLRKFGINLNDAALRQEAMAMGLTKTTTQVLPANIKAQAAYSLILKQSTTAQGDFARTSGGLANQQRIAEAKLANLSATIGQKLLPVMVTLETFFVDKVIPAFMEVAKVAGPILGGVFNVLGFIIRNFINYIVKPLVAAFQTLVKWAKSAFGWVGDVAKAAGGVLGTIGNVAGAVGSFIPHFAEGGIVKRPTLALIGEDGPEAVVPLQQFGSQQLAGASSGGGFTIRGISERELLDMVDRGLYFRLQRAAPTLGRT